MKIFENVDKTLGHWYSCVYIYELFNRWKFRTLGFCSLDVF